MSHVLLDEKLSLRILLAEDNLLNQKVLLQVLKHLGYSADLANNGLEVLDMLHRQHYDIILMDVQMPLMNGIEATRRIKQEWLPEKCPWIIAVTANTMPGDREICLEAGMDDYVSKPVDIQKLVQAIAKCQSLNFKQQLFAV